MFKRIAIVVMVLLLVLAQGYFIARPMPPDQILPWAASWQQRWVTELQLQPPPSP